MSECGINLKKNMKKGIWTAIQTPYFQNESG